MKKNELAIFVVYVAMFALALVVGIFALRPVITLYAASLPIHFVVLVVLSLLFGVVFNAVLVELGHILGAKTGGYEILSVVILGIGSIKTKGQWDFGFHTFDGLTGETKVAPKDQEKSSLGGYTFFPILFYIIEVFALIVVNSIASLQTKDNPEMAWLQIAAITVISVGGMIFLYDIFPFRLDSMNDGCLISLLTKEGNRIPYNFLLLQAKAKLNGEEPVPMPIFDDITDFTADLNNYSVYALIAKGDFDGAVAVLDKTLAPLTGVSFRAKQEASCIKLGLLLASSKTSVGKEYYESFDDELRKYIASMGSMPALRCYLLISACVEESEAEANYAIDKVEKVLESVDSTFLEAEKALVQHDKDFVAKLHPSWDLYPLPWEEKKPEPQE